MSNQDECGAKVALNDLLGVRREPMAVTWVDDGKRHFREWNPKGLLLQSLMEDGIEWQILCPEPDAETMDFARVASRLLHGFMLECNVIGAKEAGVNLAQGIKDYLAAKQAEDDA